MDFMAIELLMAEIRQAPVEVGSLSHYLQGFIHRRWLFGISSINRISPQLYTDKAYNCRVKSFLVEFFNAPQGPGLPPHFSISIGVISVEK